MSALAGIIGASRARGGGGGGWTPESVTSASVVFWLEPDSISGSTWSDKSAAGNHWALPSGHEPSVITGGAEWLSADVVRFDLGETATGIDLSSLTAGEIFILYQRDSDPATGVENSGIWHFGTAGIWPVFWTDGNWYEDFGRASRMTTGNPTLSMTSPRVIDMISVSGEWSILVDGSTHYTTATNTPSFRSVPFIGAQVGGWNYSMMGEVRAVIFYDGKLSTDDRTAVYNYLDTMR